MPLVIFIFQMRMRIHEVGLCDCVSPVCVVSAYYIYIYTTYIHIYLCITYGSLSWLLPCLLFVDRHISPFCVCCTTRKTSIIWFRCHRVLYTMICLYHIIILYCGDIFFWMCARALFEFFIRLFYSWFHYFLFPKENESDMEEIELLYFSFIFFGRVRHVTLMMIINTEKI